MKQQKQKLRNAQNHRQEQGLTDTDLQELFGKLAELVDKVAESRHIETMEAYSIIDSIITHF